MMAIKSFSVLRLSVAISFVFLMVACGKKKAVPDVSNIKVELQPIRFEQDFFALDTNHLDAGLQGLYEKHKGFSQDFLYNILGIPPQPDSVMANAKLFLTTYSNIYKATTQPFANISLPLADVKKGLQYVHYYFPKYPLPQKLITFVGPFNSYSSIITPDNSLAVGLQLYLGKQYPVYQSEELQVMYPSFIARRFEQPYIAINCMKNIVDDLFGSLQSKKKGEQLIEQMIEQGKRLYVLDALMPNAADSLKTGYTQEQLDGCIANEKNIWAFFLQGDLLYQTDPAIISSYVTDGPKTSELGDACPGDIGQFVGWQIVKHWMEKTKQTNLDATVLAKLIAIPAKTLFEEAKYKPK